MFGGATGPIAGHYEITLSESAATPFAHVQSVIQADHHSDFDYDFWIDRYIGDDSAFRPFSGEAPQTAGPDEDLYPLTEFTIKGWELEAEGDTEALGHCRLVVAEVRVRLHRGLDVAKKSHELLASEFDRHLCTIEGKPWMHPRL